MSLFGQPAQQQSAGQLQQSRPGLNIFGQAQQQPSAGGTTGVFGQQQQQQQPAAGGSSLFGQPQQNTQQGGNLLGRLGPPLGSTTTQPTGAFGQSTGQPASGTGAFGSFGGFTQQRPATTGFGQSTTGQQQPTSSFTLQPPAGQNQQSTGAFGQSGLSFNLGGTNQQQQQQQLSTFGSFGQPQQQQNQQQKPAFSWPGSSTLGQSSTFNLGQPQQQQPQQQQLGVSQLQVQPSNALQASRSTGLVGRLHQPEKTLEQRATEIAEAWNPQTSKCKFRHVFYNVRTAQELDVEPAKPYNVTDEEWQEALRMNPDPQKLYPVIVSGYHALRQRLFEQAQMANAQTVKLKQLIEKIEERKKQYSLQSSVRIQQSQLIETYLHHRILAISARLHLLMPDLRAKPISPEEEALAAALQSLDAEMSSGTGSGRMRGKVNELWTALGAYKATKEREMREGGKDATEWVVVDERGFEGIKELLAGQYRALEHLTKVLALDEFDVDHIRAEGYGIRSPTQS
ncbi:hypothetical protein CALVIDRAFT_538850 [Calocera viscosa TUFC12733]|uniref:Nucleoporin Nup54 alpha-helical domain-containing protein n=1 Tax=Calocera viscosa (strain TUFC12733) TaxID=1330018 RepID=A0A167KKQ0_CALVF|nr:hypothetical protein CALVIDRAFT_538850 [Calocera viscosa TUFC12733]